MSMLSRIPPSIFPHEKKHEGDALPSLADIYKMRPDLKIHKWLNFFHVYETHMGRFRQRPLKFLEIGVYHGGSARLFREYLGPKARIIGLDVNPECAAYADGDRLQIEIGDQADTEFLEFISRKHGPFDIVLDDGGHRTSQILTSFENLFPAVTEGGVYIIEDTCCQYWTGSEYVDRGENDWDQFIINLNKTLNCDMAKQHLFDYWHVPPAKRSEKLHTQGPDRFLHSIHLYESMAVIEKKQRPVPFCQHRNILGSASG